MQGVMCAEPLGLLDYLTCPFEQRNSLRCTTMLQCIIRNMETLAQGTQGGCRNIYVGGRPFFPGV